MIKIYKSTEEGLVESNLVGDKGSWINLVHPSREELQRVGLEAHVPMELLEYPLDEEESSRLEFEEGASLIIIKAPVVKGATYDTVPLGIIITENLLITVCLESGILDDFVGPGPRGFYTYKKTRFLLQILSRIAILYLKYLKQIDKKSEEIQQRLQKSTKNEELISLLSLQKSLVYFTTSLRSNEVVMEKLLRSRLAKGLPSPDAQSQVIKMYAEDEELLEDVIIENKQALEMGDIYTSILSNTMDAYASVISNNLNIVMKFLTSVTIVLAVPTMIASFYGMNVPIPFQNSPHAFSGILLGSAGFSLAIVMIFVKRHMF